MVLATEMTKHFEHLSKFISVLIDPIKLVAGGPDSESAQSSVENLQDKYNVPTTPENIVIVKRMLIKCADVSNPARALKVCETWANRIAEEYCNQVGIFVIHYIFLLPPRVSYRTGLGGIR